MNIAAADAFMAIFGLKRVTRLEGEDMDNYDDIETEGDTELLPAIQTGAKFQVGDFEFVDGCWREVVAVNWVDDHFEYELNPHSAKNVAEKDM